MKHLLLSAMLAVGLASLVDLQPAAADEVPQLGANPSTDELIDALTPTSANRTLKYRGLHLLTSNPGTSKEGPMPAVGLDIKFEINSARLSNAAEQTIRQLATALQSEQLAAYHFLVEGHTDSTGRVDHNMTLSRKRADAVRDELVRRYGVERNRLETAGRGPTQPIDPADPKNPANRRVQVVNIGQ